MKPGSSASGPPAARARLLVVAVALAAACSAAVAETSGPAPGAPAPSATQQPLQGLPRSTPGGRGTMAEKPLDTAEKASKVPIVPPPNTGEHGSGWWVTLKLIGAFLAGIVLGGAAGEFGLLRAGLRILWRTLVKGPAAPSRRIAATPGAKDAFSAQHRDFRDIYGALWRAAEGGASVEDSRRILVKWNERVLRIGRPALVQAWNQANVLAADGKQPRVAAQAWLAALEAWGLKRDQPETLVLDDDVLTRFYVFPETASGGLVVKEPCWWFAGAVMQKGLAAPAGP